MHGLPPRGMCSWQKQRKPAAMDQTLLSVSHKTKSHAWNTNPRGLAISCGPFLILSAGLQRAWVLNCPLPRWGTLLPKLCTSESISAKWLGLGTGSVSEAQEPSASFSPTLGNTENSRSSECVACAPVRGPLRAGPGLPLLHSPTEQPRT